MVLLGRISWGAIKQQSREGNLVGRLLFVMAGGAGSRWLCLEGRTCFFGVCGRFGRANKGIGGFVVALSGRNLDSDLGRLSG